VADGVRKSPHLKKDGKPKTAYRNEQAAQDEIERLYDAGLSAPDALRLYPCPECKKFHIGHRTSRYTTHRRRRRGSW
jgi:ribosomal protein L32